MRAITGIPIEWAEKGVRKEEHVAPELQRMRRKNQFGVYYILRSMEVGPTFRCFQPRYPVEDPDYRILRRQRSRYTHFYFYIHDPVLGALSLCIRLLSALSDQLLSQRPLPLSSES